jgi:hypothetical protein
MKFLTSSECRKCANRFILKDVLFLINSTKKARVQLHLEAIFLVSLAYYYRNKHTYITVVMLVIVLMSYNISCPVLDDTVCASGCIRLSIVVRAMF